MLSDLSHLLPLLLLDQVGVHDPKALPDRRCSGVGLVLPIQGDLDQVVEMFQAHGLL